MTERSRFDLDAALTALERDERAARPNPSAILTARVLGDAAEVTARLAAASQKAPASAERIRAGGGWLRYFGFADAWAGAAVAAVMLFLVLGFGVGYEAGPEVMAEAGFDDQETTLADAGDGLFASGDAI
jgi:hypothetical protein